MRFYDYWVRLGKKNETPPTMRFYDYWVRLGKKNGASGPAVFSDE
jgi:hypothetical protein